jgi:protein-S-isoprenylcysteine O-methyltransferase Ste14
MELVRKETYAIVWRATRQVLPMLRHLFAIAALPFMVTVAIPLWIAQRNGIAPTIGSTPGEWSLQALGVWLFAIGLVLFVSSLRRFATEGEGTLAPWDPPRKLVVHGPYRYVRNPMISGVVFILFAEAARLRSVPHVQWALIFLALNLVYIPLLEEPQLEARFGDDYREYRRHVPRIIPRLRPWRR